MEWFPFSALSLVPATWFLQFLSGDFSHGQDISWVKSNDLTAKNKCRDSTSIDPGENWQYFYNFLVHLKKRRTLEYLITEYCLINKGKLLIACLILILTHLALTLTKDSYYHCYNFLKVYDNGCCIIGLFSTSSELRVIIPAFQRSDCCCLQLIDYHYCA